MGLKICSLFSGSTGNCTYLSDGDWEILIDMGAPLSKVEKALKVLGSDLSHAAVVVTHKHSDHIGSLAAFIRKHPSVRVYAHERNVQAVIDSGVPAVGAESFGDGDFYIGSITVSPITLSHDVYCNGFSFLSGGKKITYMTDTGFLPDRAMATARDSDIVMIECNHSVELLRANKSYSESLKRRILGERGHLSNDACANAVVSLARSGVRHFILAHLSRENNYPELAYSVVDDALKAAGIEGVSLEVALHDRLSALTEVY